MSNQTLKQRQSIPTEDTWKLEDIFSSDAQVTQAFTECYKLIEQLKNYKGQVTTSSDKLLKLLKLQDITSEQVSKIYLYCNMRLHQDTSESFYQDLASKSSLLLVSFQTATSFVSTEIAQLTPSQINEFIQEDPSLKIYIRYIQEIIRQKDHILDTSTEQLLSQFQEIADAPSDIFSMFNNADITFEPVMSNSGESITLTHGNYIKLLEDKKRSLRMQAFNHFYESYLNFKNTLAQTFSSNVKQLSLFSKIRGYESTLASKLSINNIPIHVYTNLVDTINEHLPILHEYVALRKQHLQLDELHMYDLFVPLVSEVNQPISFEEACDTVLKALEPLGTDYVNVVQQAFKDRWIDKYENIGKRSGAYSWGTYGISHPYVLLNYTDTFNSLFTLAHEMGHALHSYLSNATQPAIYSHYCIFVAEVASIVNESLLMQYLLKTTTDLSKRRYLINHFMEQFRNTLYRQTMFAEFEKKVYDFHQQGNTLTTDLLCQTYYDLVQKYHGPNMIIDEPIKIEWARIPHFYTPFYVYQYATGFAAAIALSTRILQEGLPAVDAYLNFLKSGSSKDPIELLKDAGVDMTVSQPIEKSLSVFKDLIQQMKTL